MVIIHKQKLNYQSYYNKRYKFVKINYTKYNLKLQNTGVNKIASYYCYKIGLLLLNQN